MDDFYTLLQKVQKRPALYLGHKSIFSLQAFLDGYYYPTFRTSTSSIVVVCKFIAKSTQFGNENQCFSDNTFCSTD